jgi:hypothetical protein
MLTAILSIVGGLLPVILQNQGIIGSSVANLISGLTTQTTTLIQNLAAGKSASQDGLAVLAAAAGAIAVLKANTNLPAATLTYIEDIDLDVEKALAAYAVAGEGLDLTAYGQIAEVS